MITNNSYGWYINGAAAVGKTLGNNHIEDNKFANVGVLTPVGLQ